jgi:VWFA-related protein
VDVIVTDRQGRPVTDLQPADFEVRESGRPQKIDTFRLIESEILPGEVTNASPIRSLDEHERETSKDENRLFVIFLDDYHVRVENSMQVRQQLAQFVSGLSSRDLVALAMPLTPASSVLFSRNHDATAGTIMQFMGRKYDYVPRHPIEQRYAGETPQVQERFRNEITVSALSQVCERLGRIRDGKKTILYVSEGMAGSLPAGIRTRSVGRGSSLSRSAQSQSQTFFDSASLLNDLRTVFVAANRSNTSIYTIDPRGLSASEFGPSEAIGDDAGWRLMGEETDLLRTIASETDGRAIVGRNDPMPELKQMVRDNSTYYLLSYTSSLAPREGRFHSIDVRVNRRDVDVRARKGYWAYSADAVVRASTVKAAVPPDVATALERLSDTVSPARSRQFMLWAGARRGATPEAELTLAWEAVGMPGSGVTDAVDRVAVTVVDERGAEVYRGVIPKGADAVRAAGQATFEVPAGPLIIRAVGENVRGNRVETQEQSFSVPDFSATGPRIATPVIFRGRTARDLQAVRAAVSPLPAIDRQFSRTDRMLVRFDAYAPGGSSPVVAMRLLNRGGDAIASLPAPVRAGAGPFEFEMSFGSFPPGDYLIEIKAEINGDVAREIFGIHVTS